MDPRLQKLVDELFAEVPQEKRCPHIRKDVLGPYCAKGLEVGKEIGVSRRAVCDHLSLQLWCLDKERYSICIYYRGEPFVEPRLGIGSN